MRYKINIVMKYNNILLFVIEELSEAEANANEVPRPKKKKVWTYQRIINSIYMALDEA